MIRGTNVMGIRAWLSGGLACLVLAGCYAPEYPKPEDDTVIDAFPEADLDDMRAEVEDSPFTDQLAVNHESDARVCEATTPERQTN